MNQSFSQTVFYFSAFQPVVYKKFILRVSTRWFNSRKPRFRKPRSSYQRSVDPWANLMWQPVPGIISSSFPISISWKPRSSKFFINNSLLFICPISCWLGSLSAATNSYLWFLTFKIPLNCANCICWPCFVNTLCNRISFARSGCIWIWTRWVNFRLGRALGWVI